MKLTREQFDKLAMEQLDTLYRVALRLTGNTTDAEDLVQETCLRAFAASDRFDLQEYGIRPWLVRIMHNLHLNRTRQQSRDATLMDDEQLDTSRPSLLPAPWMGTGGVDSMDQRLVRALKQLSEECRSVLLLWAIEEFSYNEIAVALNIPVGTVMSRLHRARKQLSSKLHDFVRAHRVIALCA